MWIDQLEEWDEKTVEYLFEIYNQEHTQSGFIEDLNESLKSRISKVQKAGSWILKYHLEEGALRLYKKKLKQGKIEKNTEVESNLSNLLKTLVLNMEPTSEWEITLHLFQVLRYIEIDQSSKKRLKSLIDHGLASDKKFVRAWAYDGLYRLMLQYPKYQNDFEEAVSQALNKESGAVMARIRNILKEDGLHKA